MRKTLLKMLALLACLLCSLSAVAAEAYACFTPLNTTLTFYYDNQRTSRTGYDFDLNTASNNPGWCNDTINTMVRQVVFDPSFANARPTSTVGWFYNMESLESITGMEYLNTSEVTSMALMFAFCNLTNLDLSHFNTSNVTNMGAMFTNSYGLTTLDLRSFNTASVRNMSYMFNACRNLAAIYVGNGWNTAAVTNSDDMFYGCTSLVGGMETTYDANHVDASYAHIDGGTANPGYLSDLTMAYACYTPSNTTLTFYYDDQRSSRTGTTYDLNTGYNSPGWVKDGTCEYVTRAVFDPSFAAARPTSTDSWFALMDKLQNIIGLNYLNTTQVTNLRCMFEGCSLLTSLDLSGFNTEKVTSMGFMFEDCSSLTELDLSSFNTANVTSMRGMFSYTGITSLDLSGFNTANVTDMSWMFAGCSSLTELDLSSFNTAKVTSMSSMFRECTGLTSLDLSHFNTANVTTMSCMFQYCASLTSLDLSSFNTVNVNYMHMMFQYCVGLTSLDLSSFNTNNVTDMGQMFENCYYLTTIYAGSGWSTDHIVEGQDMFYGCDELVGGKGTAYDPDWVDETYAHIDGGPSDPGYFTAATEAYACYTPSNTTLTFYYDDQRSYRSGTIYELNTGENEPGWYRGVQNGSVTVTRAVFDPSFADARPTSTCNWFGRMQHLTSITGMKNYLNTSAVTNMSHMFYYCTTLENIDVSGLNTSNVTDMKYMFFYCHALSYLDLRNFNTAKVTNMESMFSGCDQLSSLNLSAFNTANVTDMDYMFQGCTGLSNLNMKNFNTSNVTSMDRMFSGCSSLTSLDLSSFNTSQVTVMFHMFRGCSELTTIYVGDCWSTSSVTSSNDMFLDCIKIKGSQGTTYDANHVNKTYARIDGGTAKPGYLSEVKVPYAVYTPDNTTLTFYYDGQRSSRPGTSYDLNDEAHDAGWYTDGSYSSVAQVVFDPSFADASPKSTFCWFSGMTSLKAITGMEYLNTSEVTSMYAMFFMCNALDSLDLSGFNTANVVSMMHMFGNCSRLTSLDLSSFNTAKVVDMSQMFNGCSNLTTICAGDEWSTAAVTSSTSMFKNCIHLVGSQGTTYDADHTDAAYAHIDGGPSNPGYFTGPIVVGEPYAVYTPENTTLTFYYDDQRGTRPGTTYDLNTGTNQPDWVIDGTNSSVTQVVFDPSFADARPTSTRTWFYCMETLSSISSIEYLNTSEVTDMAAMFIGCAALTSLDLSGFNTDRITEVFNMFYGCSNLTSLDVSSFNTANVQDMRGMFRDCSRLTSLDLSGFNTAKVSHMGQMFSNCSGLNTIYVGDGWSTTAILYSGDMFTGCTNLVGGMGTTYDAEHTDAAYAHIDGGPSDPGYLSRAFLRGDVDNNKIVDIADVTALIDYLLTGVATGINLGTADVNNNQVVDIADVTTLIDYLLNGTW